MAIFSVGTKIKIRHTGDEGVVTAILSDGMVKIYLEHEKIEIPAFEDDLINVADFYENQDGKTKIVKGKQNNKKKAPQRSAAEAQYMILKSYGIQLAFLPIYKSDYSIERFEIYLINDTKFDVLFALTFLLNGEKVEHTDGKLNKTSMVLFSEIWYDELSDYPVFELDCWKVDTLGTGNKLHKLLKIKPKQFFKNTKTAPILNRKVHWYCLISDFKEPEIKKDKEDLRTYTKNNHTPKKQKPRYRRNYATVNVEEYANFEIELDLHIEKLMPNYEGKSSKRIINIQLEHFEDYLEKAIRLGVDKVYIIHGLGKGRLRDLIATRLMQHPQVKSFKNEYHPKYGWGATEVVF